MRREYEERLRELERERVTAEQDKAQARAAHAAHALHAAACYAALHATPRIPPALQCGSWRSMRAGVSRTTRCAPLCRTSIAG